jgi:hypothetical protein
MKRIKTRIFAILMVVAVASLFTVCKASGAGSGSDPEENGGNSALSVKAISAFSVTSPVEAEAVGVIDQTEHTIAVNVPYGTAVTGMTVSISHTGASVSPDWNATVIDFTGPQTFTVTAVDGSKQDYTVTVYVGSSTNKEIASFSIISPVAVVGVIDEEELTISVNVSFGTAVTGMNISVSHTGTSIDPSDTTGFNFAAPIIFTVTAADDSTRAYTVTVNFEPAEISFNSSGGGTAPATITWSSGAGLTLPDAGSMEKDALFFCGWAEDSDSGAYAVSPYIPTRDVTLYALWRDVQAIIDESLARLDASPKVIGNPADNSPEAQELSAVVAQLMTLLEGETDVRTINDGQGENGQGTQETYKVYDYPEIYKKSGELETLSADFSGEIIVESMYFQYVATTAENDDPYQCVRLKTAGVYEIELAGAAGGHMWTGSGKTSTGGKGGHVKAEYNVGANTDVDIRIGGQGRGLAHYDGTKYAPVYTSDGGTTISYTVKVPPVTGITARDRQPGGYNGGGYGGNNTQEQWPAGSGGGGATDVRLAGNMDELTGSADDPRIAVAGGGGGAVALSGDNPSAGGNAGGLTGGDGAANISSNAPKGGNQINGGTQPVNCTPGSPGKGTDGADGYTTAYNMEGRGGGGAGWWGGGALTNNNGTRIASGAGGSSYTGGAGAITPDTSVLTPVNETIQNNVWDDGWARITWKR